MKTRALKRSGIVLCALFMCLPFFVSAENACPTLSLSLSLGAQGDDVLQLQKFLMNDGELLSDAVTGNFGQLTQTAVGNWQKDHRIVTSKDPGSGWGVLGPRTRAAIAAQCDSGVAGTGSTSGGGVRTSTTPATTTKSTIGRCRALTPPVALCTASWQGVRGSNGCVGSWYCVAVVKAAATTSISIFTSTTTRVSATNAPPTITNLVGPDTLNVGERGAWTVTASDPEGAALTYSFTWGDTGASSFDQIRQLAQTFTPTASGTHSYAHAGTYQVSVTVHDPALNVAQASVHVTVAGSSSNTVFGVDPTTPGTGGTSTSTMPYTYWCANGVGSLGYWSQTPCNSGVTDIWATSTNPFGSSSSNVVEGGICAPEGRQEFVACPNMQNCMGGGTYYLCKNRIWTRMIVY